MGRTLKYLFLVAVAAAALRYGMARRLGWHDVVQSGAELASGKTTADLRRRARRDILQRNLKHAIEGYRAATRENPASLDDLVRQGLLDESDRLDEWERALHMGFQRNEIVVRSWGADGYRDTDDDWVLTL